MTQIKIIKLGKNNSFSINFNVINLLKILSKYTWQTNNSINFKVWLIIQNQKRGKYFSSQNSRQHIRYIKILFLTSEDKNWYKRSIKWRVKKKEVIFRTILAQNCFQNHHFHIMQYHHHNENIAYKNNSNSKFYNNFLTSWGISYTSWLHTDIRFSPLLPGIYSHR